MSEQPHADAAAVWRLAAITFIGGLGGGVVFPIIPIEGLKLGISAAMVGLILSFNRITRLAVNPFSGGLVDRFGARLPLALGLLVEAVATLCFSAGLHGAPTFWFLFGRGLWGVGSSLLMVGAMTAALLFSHASGRGMASAKVRMAMSFGVPGGLILGGLISDLFSADSAFLSATAITLVGMAGALRFVPGGKRSAPADQRTDRRRGVDWRGLLEVLRPGPLWVVWLFNFILFFSAQGVILASLALVVQQRGLSVAGLGAQGSSGLLMAAMIGTSAVVSLLIGRRLDGSGQARAVMLLPASLVMAVGYVLLALATNSALAALALCLVGFGIGGINIPLMVLLGDLTGRERYGRSVGIYQVLGDLGGSLGPIIGLAAIHHYGSRPTLLVIAVALLVMVPLAVGLRRWEVRRPPA